MVQRLDVGAARQELQATSYALAAVKGLAVARRAARGREPRARIARARRRSSGPPATLELPIFDQKQAAVARLRSAGLRRPAPRDASALAVNARSEVREARDRAPLRAAAGRALPRRDDPAARAARGAVAGAIQCDAARRVPAARSPSRARSTPTGEYIEAVRDYWMARAELERAIGGRLPGAPPSSRRNEIAREAIVSVAALLAGGAALLASGEADAQRRHGAAGGGERGEPRAGSVHAGRHAQRRLAAVEDGGRREAVPPRRRAGEARVRARAWSSNCWGYNGQTPGPTIEAVEGDRVRILVTNKLPERTSVHWHGVLLPNGMDGVAGLKQPHIQPGETYAYEFTLRQHGTLMYHPHSDEMVQMALGHDGLLHHPPAAPERRASIATSPSCCTSGSSRPATSRPNPAVMTDFNLFTFNSRVCPGHDAAGRPEGRSRARPLREPQHGQPPDPPPRPPLQRHGHRRRARCRPRARYPRPRSNVPVGRDARHRVRRRRPGRLGLPLPQVAPHDERDGHDLPNMIGVDQDGRRGEGPQACCPATWRWARAGMGRR